MLLAYEFYNCIYEYVLIHNFTSIRVPILVRDLCTTTEVPVLVYMEHENISNYSAYHDVGI